MFPAPASHRPAEVIAGGARAPPAPAPAPAAPVAPMARGLKGPKQGELIATKGKGSGGSEKKDGAQSERIYCERVLVNVYDLGNTLFARSMNKVAKSYGLYHSSVEIYGREWSFGMTFDDFSTGVTWNPPGENPDHTFREKLLMGYTSLSPEGVWRLIEELKYTWKGCTYNILTRNCHHFTDCLSVRLGVGKIPAWINEAAGVGAATVEFVDTADSGYDGGEAIYDMFAGIKETFASVFSGGSRRESPPRQKNLRDAGYGREGLEDGYASDEAEDDEYRRYEDSRYGHMPPAARPRSDLNGRGAGGDPAPPQHDPFEVLRQKR
eukprot:gnl/TRDRNA2_/TRDRNA2_82006_c0_seq2.p1 gnl/TRDRNA2_/TRDRNA2_82006_c0~~gnl/TRDRNA2_/TRDRNA2_82006_c0_seq2.p1  ORF type:complete len:372 (+),score=55.59 gnl/TRDRNA2_/TRDRNA2_82006_c0_seq2:148-1116(+)